MTDKVETHPSSDAINTVLNAAIAAGKTIDAKPEVVLTAGAYLASSVLQAKGFTDGTVETDDYVITINITKKVGSMEA